jgi:hypothetical protein
VIYEIDASGFERAVAELPGRLDVRLREGLDLTCEAIAARARETTTFVDRSGLLRSSIQNAGVTGTPEELVGIVSFAARSDQGALYGVFLEFGTHQGARSISKRQERREAGARFTGPRQRKGIKARRFIRDAVDAQDGSLIEGSMGAAFRDSGFGVGPG